MANNQKSDGTPVEARLGVVFRPFNLESMEFTGELGFSNGQAQLCAAARNVDIRDLFDELNIPTLPDELNGLNILIETLYLRMDIDDKREISQEFRCKINLEKERIVRNEDFKDETIWKYLCSEGLVKTFRGDRNKARVIPEPEFDKKNGGKLESELNKAISDVEAVKRILYPQMTLGDKQLPLASLGIHIITDGKEISEVTISLHGNFENGNGIPLVSDDVTVKNFDLEFEYSKESDNGSKWILKGSIDIFAFERDFKLSASYERINESDRIQLKTEIGDTKESIPCDFFMDKNREISLEDSKKIRDQLKNSGYLDNDYCLTNVSLSQLYNVDFKDPAKNKYKDFIVCRLFEYTQAKPTPPTPFITIPNLLKIGEAEKVADLSIRELALSIERTNSNVSWEFLATGDFNIYSLAHSDKKIFELHYGEIRLHVDEKQKRLTFKAESAGTKPFSEIPGFPSYLRDALEVQFKQIEIIASKDKGWECSAVIDLLFAKKEQSTPPDIIDMIGKVFPRAAGTDDQDKITSKVTISSTKGIDFTLTNTKGIEVTPGNIFKNIDFPEGLEELKERSDIGTSYFSLERIGIHIGDDFNCSATLAIGLPSKLNDALFGIPEIKDGSVVDPPFHGLIKTYVKKKIIKEKIIRPDGSFDDIELKKQFDANLLKATLEVGTEGITGYLEKADLLNIEKLTQKGIREETEHIIIDFDALLKKSAQDKKAAKQKDEKEEFGKIRIVKPKIKIDPKSGTFKASGGYEVLSDQLMIPIGPIFKILLLALKPKDDKNGDLAAIADLLPKGIPVQSVYFFKDGEFYLDNFEDWLKKGLPDHAREAFSLPAPLKQLIEQAGGELLNRLPEAFKEYLNIILPKGFNFDINIGGDGTFSFNIEVPPQKDAGTGQFSDYIQLLIPTPLGLGTLFGIRLKKLGFGTALANTCLRLDLSARLDIFDLAQLGACFILEDKDKIRDESLRLMMPDRKRLGQRYEAQNLIMFIIIATPVPIPIPIFYDKLYSSYFGLEGIESENRLRFSKPETNLMELFTALKKLEDFFKKPDYSLPLKSYPYEQPPTEEKGWIFGAGPMYTQLPCLMGYEEVNGVKQNIVIGTKETHNFDLFELIYLSGNTLKFLILNKKVPVELIDPKSENTDPKSTKKPLNYLIEYLPLERRIGFKQIKLFHLFDFDAAWAFSTPDEFEQTVYPLMLKTYEGHADQDKVPDTREPSSPNELLELLVEKTVSVAAVDEDQGVVLFLRGGLGIARQISLEGAIGLMLSEQKGFRTGLSLKGKFFNWVESASFFFLKINPNDPQEVVKILGTTFLKVFEREVLKGHIEVTNADLKFQGMLDLFPTGFPIQLKGFANGHINPNKFFLDAGCGLQLGAFMAGAQLKVHIDEVQQLLQADLVFANSLLHFRVFHQKGEDLEWLSADLVANAFNLLVLEGHLRFKREARRLQLLGSTSLSIPFLDLLHVQLDYAGELNLDAGFLSLSAQLTGDSYILTKNCRPTGGAAFCVWFPKRGENETESQAGDFVLTVGGYHPNFRVPSHYPRVPPVGIQWEIDRYTHIRGEAYFALTPIAIMAGSRLDLVYQRGDIRVWFTAYADFLCQWKPIYFDAEIGLSVGASYTLRVGAQVFGRFIGVTKTFSISIKALLHLWGPPTGGRVEIKLPIVTIAIHFGEKHTPQLPLTWEEFKKDFLLNGKEDTLGAIFQIVPQSGVQDVKELQNNEKEWIVRGDELSFIVTTKVPASKAHVITKDPSEPIVYEHDSKKDCINIRPLELKDIKNIQSILKIGLSKEGQTVSPDLVIEPIKSNVPAALWGSPKAESLSGEEALVKGEITGLEFSPAGATCGDSMSASLSYKLIKEDNLPTYKEMPSPDIESPSLDSLFNKISEMHVTRSRVFEQLNGLNLYDEDDDFGLKNDDLASMKDAMKNEWRHCPRIVQSKSS